MPDFPESPEAGPTVNELLCRAKEAIESAHISYRAAGDNMAAARQKKATLEEIAEAVGKSVPWVSVLLQWHARGNWDETPFGPQSKASRKRRAESLQAPKVEQKQSAPLDDPQATTDDNRTATDESTAVESTDGRSTVETHTVTVTAEPKSAAEAGEGSYLPAFDFATHNVTMLVGGSTAAVMEVAVKIGATFSAGSEWPDYRRAERGDVVWLSSRTGVARALRAKFDAAGAYIHGVRFVDPVRDGLGLPIRNLSDDLRRLDQRLPIDGPVKCVVIDYFAEYTSVGIAERPVPDFRQALDALQEFAVNHQTTIILICQFSTRDDEAVAGAVLAIKAMEGINNVLLVQRDGKQNRGVVRRIANELKQAADSYTFQLRNRNGAPAVVWETPQASGPAPSLGQDRLIGAVVEPEVSPTSNALTETDNVADGVAEPATVADDPNDDCARFAVAVEETHSVADTKAKTDKRFELLPPVKIGERVIEAYRIHRPGAAK